MPNILLTQAQREAIQEFAEKRGICNIRVFGSFARGEAREDSDLDLLVNLSDGHTLIDLGGFLMDVQDVVGRKVDVVMEDSLHWYIKDNVLHEAKPL